MVEIVNAAQVEAIVNLVQRYQELSAQQDELWHQVCSIIGDEEGDWGQELCNVPEETSPADHVESELLACGVGIKMPQDDH